MNFLKITKKVARLALILLAVVAFTSVFVKIDAECSVTEYPFAKGEYVLANAPTVVGQSQQADGVYQW